MKLDILWRSFFWFWLGLAVVGLIKAHLRSVTVIDDLKRNQVSFYEWEPYVWEYSSTLVLLLLVIGVFYLVRQFSLFNDKWSRNLAIHLLGSVAFSLLHVLMMVAMRKIYYSLVGSHYDFGDWSIEFWYEFRKDFITYFTLLLLIELYLYLKSINHNTPIGHSEKIKVKTPNGTVWLSMDEIYTIESGGNYVYIKSKDQVLLYRKTMAQMQKQLQAARFMRVHRSYIVNLEMIKATKQQSNDPFFLLLLNDTEIPVSRKYRHDVLNQMNL